MAHLLTKGALADIMQGGNYDQPVVQVLTIKKVSSSSGQPEKDRYRTFISDGQNTVSFAMMTAPVYAKIGPNKEIQKYSIMKIRKYVTSVINNSEGKDSRVLLILDFEILEDGDGIGQKIGNPVPCSDKSASGTLNGASMKPGTNDVKPNSRPASSPNGDCAPSAKVPRMLDSANVKSSTSNGQHLTHPISSLSPYHNKWIIKARVTSKSDIRKWENAKGSGQLFSFDLIDESGEIRCTAFREMVDKFFPMIEVDKVYYISKCQLKPANKQYSSLKNDYEMSVTSETVIEECLDDPMEKLQTRYEFVPISQIANIEKDQTIDVIGVAKHTSELQTFQAKTTGRELKKRDVQLIDQSNTVVSLTLWGTQAENFDGSGNPVIALKSARVGEFGGGKQISTISSTVMKINPEIKECYQLKGWYESVGANVNVNDISLRTGGPGNFQTPWMCFKEVVDQQVGMHDNTRGEFYQVKGTILLLRTENCLYKACPSESCNKKVVDQNDGTFHCEKCQKSYEGFKYRLLCSMNVGDWSGNQWVSMFSDEAAKVIGTTADEAGELFDNDKHRFTELMESTHFKEFIFKCRAKMENYNDESRLKTVAVRVDPINYEEYNNHLINNIKQLTNNY
ncbi:replication protein A 70 kDa DNA-binding subunit [Anthonomus grandis grandis]|uniref:replication protein A 70 kDa DNA-binding subunit n=1 Tax=Anthonomus grandis grandis TaxID=2921223 RepID=UPI002165CBDC|nr:replication protein A 70 kDa DNA-binding subunit [Anthonomus grandis grandis]